MGATGEGSSAGTSNGKGLFSGDDFMRPDLCNCNATVESLGIPFGPPIKCVLASQGIDTIGKLSTISASLAKNIFREYFCWHPLSSKLIFIAEGDLLRRVTAALKAYKPVSSPTTVSSSTFRFDILCAICVVTYLVVQGRKRRFAYLIGSSSCHSISDLSNFPHYVSGVSK